MVTVVGREFLAYDFGLILGECSVDAPSDVPRVPSETTLLRPGQISELSFTGGIGKFEPNTCRPASTRNPSSRNHTANKSESSK